MKEFKDRVAVVTGAGGGIGRAVSIELARRGAHVALVDVSETGLQGTQEALSQYGVNTSTHIVDVSDKQQMAALPDQVVAQHGKVNILVNNAGITFQKQFSNHTLEDWEKIVGINWWGVLYGCHYFLDHLKAAGEGHIVNLSSMTAFIGLPSQASYCATKAAVKLLSESIWGELAAHNIGVTSVHPGAVKTDILLTTMQTADSREVAEKTHAMVQKIGISSDYAARRIVKAIEKNHFRIRIGLDAVLVDWLKRWFPVGIQKLTRKN